MVSGMLMHKFLTSDNASFLQKRDNFILNKLRDSFMFLYLLLTSCVILNLISLYTSPSVWRILQYYNNEHHIRYQTYVFQPSLATEYSWFFVSLGRQQWMCNLNILRRNIFIRDCIS